MPPNRSEAPAMNVMSFTRPALAKINLYLHVTAVRDDGFHELDSLVVFADVGDVVTARAGDGLSLSIDGPFSQGLDCDSDDNLVIKAARALAAHGAVPANAALHLEKNLPIASGIGGGSADAAATLLALTELWSLELPDEHIRHAATQLVNDPDRARMLEHLFKLWRADVDGARMHALAQELGADVPVCLEGRAVFMGGIGERLSLAPTLPPVWMVLVNPGVSLSTPSVFKAREGEFSAPARFKEAPRDAAHLSELLADRGNDLMAPALALAPEIGAVLEALNAQPGTLLARMSGSGATCFGLYSDAGSAQNAAKNIQLGHAQWWVTAAKMVDVPQGL